MNRRDLIGGIPLRVERSIHAWGQWRSKKIRRKPQRIWFIEGVGAGNLRQVVSKCPRLPVSFVFRIDFAGHRRTFGPDWTGKAKEGPAHNFEGKKNPTIR